MSVTTHYHLNVNGPFEYAHIYRYYVLLYDTAIYTNSFDKFYLSPSLKRLPILYLNYWCSAKSSCT